jgi:uncharacterized protein YcbX
VTARVVRITLFPFKSLDGVDVASAAFAERGALAWDRAFAFVDDAGDFVTAKRTPRMHTLRVAYEGAPDAAVVRSEATGASARFAFDGDPIELEALVGAHVGEPVRLQRDDAGGFPDDVQSPGPTIVSTATLTEVGSWFGFPLDEMRARLRANIEIDGVPAFWEDRLVAPEGSAVPFAVGEATFGGTNPCARCVVPSRDPWTGDALPTFQKRVAERRAATLPEWAERSRFDHFYRLTVNTQLLAASGPIRIGDTVELREAAGAVR